MLGFILAPLGQRVEGQPPSEIQYSFGGGGSAPGAYLCPPDPMNNERGEQGFFTDTALGRLKGKLKGALNGLRGIPTDAEMASVYGYTPVASGWVAMQQADGSIVDYPSPWVPPSAWNPAGNYGPQPSLNGLGYAQAQRQNLHDAPVDVTIPTGATQSESQAIVDALNKQNARVFKVTIISTVIVGGSALFGAYRVWKQLQRDERLNEQLKKKLGVPVEGLRGRKTKNKRSRR